MKSQGLGKCFGYLIFSFLSCFPTTLHFNGIIESLKNPVLNTQRCHPCSAAFLVYISSPFTHWLPAPLPRAFPIP